VARQHRGLRIGRQSVLRPDLVERFGHDVRSDEGSGGRDQDAGVRESQLLGHDGRPEVGLLPDHDVRPPGLADRLQVGRPAARQPAPEAVAQIAELALHVDFEERPRDGREALVRPGGVGLEAEFLRPGHHPRPRRDGHGMPGSPRRGCERHERLEVAAPTRAREQDAHRASVATPRWRGATGTLSRAPGAQFPAQRRGRRTCLPPGRGRGPGNVHPIHRFGRSAQRLIRHRPSARLHRGICASGAQEAGSRRQPGAPTASLPCGGCQLDRRRPTRHRILGSSSAKRPADT